MSGENPNDRKVIERVTERGIKSGLPPAVAHREAVASMQRVDRQRRDGIDGERRR